VETGEDFDFKFPSLDGSKKKVSCILSGIFGGFRPSLKIKILFFFDFQGKIEDTEKIPKVSYLILSYLIFPQR
jgi:hypothetical protein